MKHAGEPNEKVVPLVQENVWPSADFEIITAIDAQMGITAKSADSVMAVVLAVVGFALIFGLERISAKK